MEGLELRFRVFGILAGQFGILGGGPAPAGRGSRRRLDALGKIALAPEFLAERDLKSSMAPTGLSFVGEPGGDVFMSSSVRAPTMPP